MKNVIPLNNRITLQKNLIYIFIFNHDTLYNVRKTFSTL